MNTPHTNVGGAGRRLRSVERIIEEQGPVEAARLFAAALKSKSPRRDGMDADELAEHRFSVELADDIERALVRRL